MTQLNLTLEDEISFLNRYRLVPNELVFIKLLLILQDENNEILFRDYINILKQSRIKLRELIFNLQDKEIINKSYKIPNEGTLFNPYEIPVNKNFIKNLYKAAFELGKELFETYPQFGNIGESVVPLRTVAKKFDSLEEAYFRYGKAIGYNPEKHNHILELVKWGKENNIINCSLASFIINNGWLDLEAMKDGKIANFNYDNMKLL